MQSSSRNARNERLNTCVQARTENRHGLDGTCPTRANLGAVAIEGRSLALAALAGQEAHRRADAAGEEEAGAERARCDHRQVRAHLADYVRRLAEPCAQPLDRSGELVPLGLDLEPHRLRAASVRLSHGRSP